MKPEDFLNSFGPTNPLSELKTWLEHQNTKLFVTPNGIFFGHVANLPKHQTVEIFTPEYFTPWKDKP